MNAQFKKRLKRTLIFATLAFVIGAGLGAFQIKQAQKALDRAPIVSQPIAGAEGIGGSFTLTDHNGNTVTQDTYAGQYKFIYFGFTFCPDVCPTELQKMSKVISTLGAKANNIQPLLISIDPARDTPEVLREYVPLFHPKLIGLTGTEAEVDTVINDFKIYASKVQHEDANDYVVNHSSYIYLMSPDNTLITLYKMDDSAEFIENDIAARI